MNLTIEERDDLMDRIAERFIAAMGSKLEKVECLTINRVDGILDLTSPQVNKMITEWVDFGPRGRRLTVAQARKLIEQRKVKRGKERRA